jgi:hypothetical protein
MARTMTLPHGITTEQIRKATGRETALWLVIHPETIANVGPTIIGMIEKYHNTRTDTHPYKAIRGVGMDAEFLSAHYGKDGFAAAIRAIVA